MQETKGNAVVIHSLARSLTPSLSMRSVSLSLSLSLPLPPSPRPSLSLSLPLSLYLHCSLLPLFLQQFFEFCLPVSISLVLALATFQQTRVASLLKATRGIEQLAVSNDVLLKMRASSVLPTTRSCETAAAYQNV